MNHELADHIALIAAPIYAALLTAYNATAAVQTPEKLEQIRNAAVYQAVMLRKLALETPLPR